MDENIYISSRLWLHHSASLVCSAIQIVIAVCFHFARIAVWERGCVRDAAGSRPTRTIEARFGCPFAFNRTSSSFIVRSTRFVCLLLPYGFNQLYQWNSIDEMISHCDQRWIWRAAIDDLILPFSLFRFFLLSVDGNRKQIQRLVSGR